MRAMRSLAVVALLLAVGGCTTVPEEPEPSGPAPPADPEAGVERSVVSVQIGQSVASGVVLTVAGHILTNSLATTGAADPVTVTVDTGKSAPATIAGDDPRTGLAVVKVDGVPDLTPAVFGDSDAVQPGDEVRVIGGPLVTGPVAPGAVLDTTVRFGDVTGFATDAPAARGTAGGPLVNTAGEVIGIVAGFRSTGEGTETGVAIPANLASRVADQLRAGEPVTHPYLGVAVDPADGGGALVREVSRPTTRGRACCSG